MERDFDREIRVLGQPAGRQWWRMAGLLGLPLFLAGAALLLVQFVIWLRFGTWYSFSLMELWYAAGLPFDLHWTAWEGVAQVSVWIMQQSAWIELTIGGLVILWLAGVG